MSINIARLISNISLVLATLQDREALPDILSFLRDERVDASVRRAVAQALATLRDLESLPDILAFLHDERVDAWMSRDALNALWRLACSR